MSEEITVYTIFKDLVSLGCTIAVAYFAKRGLDTWREQLRGTHEFGLAKEVLTFLYQYRNAFNFVRMPSIGIHEIEEAKNNLTNEQRDQHFYQRVKVYESRLANLRELQAKIQSHLVQSEVVWGAEFIKKVDAIWSLQYDLDELVFFYMEMQNPAIEPSVRDSYRVDYNSKAYTIYCGPKDTDALKESILQAVNVIDHQLRRSITGKSCAFQ